MVDVELPRTRYRTIIADSRRWDDFAFRPGDIVISTRRSAAPPGRRCHAPS